MLRAFAPSERQNRRRSDFPAQEATRELSPLCEAGDKCFGLSAQLDASRTGVKQAYWYTVAIDELDVIHPKGRYSSIRHDSPPPIFRRRNVSVSRFLGVFGNITETRNGEFFACHARNSQPSPGVSA